MSIADRIKTIRESKELNQREFSAKIKIAQGTLAQFETGVRTAKEIHITAICREFNVNEQWLRTGEGEMFNETLAEEIDQLAVKYNLNDLEKTLILEYGSLNDGQKQIFRQFFKKVVSKLSEEDVATTGPEIKPVATEKEENKEVKSKKYIPVSTDADIEAELAAYRKELEAEKKGQLAYDSTKEKKVVKAK